MQESMSANINKPIREIAYEKLKHAIITGEIPAGSRLVETHFSQVLHISRTPLREAFRMLELDGLVEYTIRRGVVVRAFTIDDIEEVFSIRNALMALIIPSIIERVSDEDIANLEAILADMDEAQAAQDAKSLSRLNRSFHKALEQISDKKRILRVIDSQEEYIVRFSELSIASVVRRSTAQQEHHAMVAHLKNKDLEQFQSLSQHHLEESKQVCLQAVRSGKAIPRVSDN